MQHEHLMQEKQSQLDGFLLIFQVFPNVNKYLRDTTDSLLSAPAYRIMPGLFFLRATN